MRKHLSSAKSAKDKAILVDLDDMALAMHADATGMTDEEYAAAQARLEKRRKISQSRKATRQELLNVVYAVAFLLLSTTAIVLTIVWWDWK